jgi:hypothetical protein
VLGEPGQTTASNHPSPRPQPPLSLLVTTPFLAPNHPSSRVPSTPFPAVNHLVSRLQPPLSPPSAATPNRSCALPSPPHPHQALGLEVRSVLAIGGIGGLAIGLAGREICENLLNGFLLMTTVRDRPLAPFFGAGGEVCSRAGAAGRCLTMGHGQAGLRGQGSVPVLPGLWGRRCVFRAAVVGACCVGGPAIMGGRRNMSSITLSRSARACPADAF